MMTWICWLSFLLNIQQKKKHPDDDDEVKKKKKKKKKKMKMWRSLNPHNRYNVCLFCFVDKNNNPLRCSSSSSSSYNQMLWWLLLRLVVKTCCYLLLKNSIWFLLRYLSKTQANTHTLRKQSIHSGLNNEWMNEWRYHLPKWMHSYVCVCVCVSKTSSC